jgi:hypothetical protein
VHKYPHFAVPEPRIGFLQEALRWWDRWLKDAPTGVEDDPELSLYLMDGVRPATWYEDRPGRWMADPDMRPERQYLAAGGVLGGEGVGFETLVASPADTGMEAGEYCAIWLGPEMPGDQRGDDARSACWDGAALGEDMDISGAPMVRLRLRSDRAQGQVAVRLCHLHPDGASTRITYGVLNLSHRNGHETPEPLVPGEEVEVALALDHIAYRVPKGHRLRLAVSNAYWPLLWPAPEAGALTVTGGHVDLPLVEGRPGSRAFLPPEAEAPWQVEELRAPQNARRVERDMKTGVVSLIIEDDFGKRRDLGHGLISGGAARERWEIHPDDPLSARGETHWTEETERGDIRLRTETFSRMTCDSDRFFLKARVEAYENDVLVFKKDVAETIPRDHL